MITPFDIVFCENHLSKRSAVFPALLILQTAGIMLGLSDVPIRPLSLITAIVLFAWMAFALALIVACYGYFIPLVGRFAHVISYFAMPVSGAFITMSLLPRWTHNFMSWNPMMSIFELARYGQFANSTDKYVYLGYNVEINILLTYWGLAGNTAYSQAHPRVLTSIP